MPVQTEEAEDYKTKYKNLKRKLKILIYENECFQEELRSANRSLLRVKQDKSFLLDQLMPYHQQPVSSSDSDLTDNSDTEAHIPIKRKRDEVATGLPSSGGPYPNNRALGPASSTKGTSSSQLSTTSSMNKKKPSLPTASKLTGKQAVKSRQRRTASTKPTNKLSSNAQSINSLNAASSDPSVEGVGSELSREEVERHLLARQPIADYNTPVSLTLPHQLFSDNILDGDLLGEEIETSPSNIDEDITVDNYD